PDILMMSRLSVDNKHVFSELDDPERQDLIRRIVEQDPSLCEIPRGNFFFLWFADIEVLRKHASLRGDSDITSLTLLLKRLPASDIAGIWALTKTGLQSKPASRATPRTASSSASVRSRSGSPSKGKIPVRQRSPLRKEIISPPLFPLPPNVPNTVAGPSRPVAVVSVLDTASCKSASLQRDGYMCVVTKLGQPTLQSAHILPSKLNREEIESETWGTLKMFFGPEQVAALKSEILGNDNRVNAEYVSNFITLSVQVHQWWDRAMIAFRPVWMNEDKAEMDVTFHWLPLCDQTQKRSEKVPISAHPYPSQRQGWTKGPSDRLRLFDVVTEQVIRSGFIFRITTSSAEKRPLPSWELMSLKWNLSRIAAMQGAGEEEDSDIDSDGGSVAVPSGSRSPVKEERTPKEYTPFRSPTRSRSISPVKEGRTSKENTPFRSPTRSRSISPVKEGHTSKENTPFRSPTRSQSNSPSKLQDLVLGDTEFSEFVE
ncbi:uncharacterized protein N7446_006990, partial [Penicillium canescens]